MLHVHGALTLASPLLRVTDAVVGLSYVAISATLALLLIQARRHMPFQSVFVAFGLFIIACGAGHMLSVIAPLWQAEVVTNAVALVTALVSLTTAVALPRYIPLVLGVIRAISLDDQLSRLGAALPSRGAASPGGKLDTLNEIAWMKDLDSRYVEVSSQFAALHGNTRAGIIGMRDEDLYSAEQSERHRMQDTEVLAAGTTLKFENMHSAEDGTLLWSHTVKAPHRDFTGKLIGTVGVARDITDERRLAQALGETEERFNLLADHLNAVLYVVDLVAQRVLYVSPVFDKMWGFPREKLYENHALFMAGILEEDRESVYAALEKQRTGQRIDLEYRVCDSEGHIRWIHDRAYIIGDENGAPSRVVGIAQDISEAKSKDEALTRSEALFRSLIENSSEMKAILSDDGRFVYVSPSVVRLLGYTPSELIGRRPVDFVHPDDHNVMQNTYLALLAKPSLFLSMTVRLQHKDGSWRYHEGIGQNMMHDPAVAGITSNSRDVTERIEATQALRQSEELFRALLENSAELVAVLHANGEFRYLSRSAERVAGLKPADVVGRSLFEVLHPDDVPAVRESLQAAVQHPGGMSTIRMPLRRADGSIRMFEGTTVNMMHHPAIRGVVTNLRDVTVRAAQQAELQFRAHLLDVVQQAVVATDTELRITYWSRYAEVLHGWSAEEAAGRDILDVLSSEELTAQRSEFLQALAGGSSWNGEYAFTHRNGEVVTGRIALTAMRDADGSLAGFVGITEDVSGRRLLEQQLRQSQKMEAIGRLAGGVAHDFNNLLTIIQNHNEFVREALGTSHELSADVEQIHNASMRAGSLTRQLLAFSRQQILEPRVVDVNAAVAELSRMVTRLVGDNVDLRTITNGRGLRVFVDPGQLEQVIMNLIVNARDAMPQGGTISITTGKAELGAEFVRQQVSARPGTYVKIMVSDTGEGMSAETQTRIFDPFFTTKEPGKGTGLGLATVYGIVKQSNGLVDVESQLGAGTTFTVYLPLNLQDVPAPDIKRAASAGDEGTETILLVEDEQAVRALAQRVLERRGYKVLAAGNGPDALRIAAEYSGDIHLVLTDAVMPHMSGQDLAKRLLYERPELHFVLMSGYTREDLLRDGGGSTAAFLQKPFTNVQLASLVRAVLDSRSIEPTHSAHAG